MILIDNKNSTGIMSVLFFINKKGNIIMVLRNIVASLITAGFCAALAAGSSNDHLAAAAIAGSASLFTFYIMVTAGFKFTKE